MNIPRLKEDTFCGNSIVTAKEQDKCERYISRINALKRLVNRILDKIDNN